MEIIEKIKIYWPKKSLQYIVSELWYIFYYGFIRKSYSQHQEDLIIDQLLWYKNKWFYVDVWAFEPNRMSNTKRFYHKWRTGINVEPNPSKINLFRSYRPQDINLNIWISKQAWILDYFDFLPSTLWTFSVHDKSTYIDCWFKLINTIKVPTSKLENIFDEYLVNWQHIDFLSLDVEWYDLEVLESNDRNKYRPSLICVEVVTPDKINEQNNSIINYLLSIGYEIIYHNWLNAIFRDIK